MERLAGQGSLGHGLGEMRGAISDGAGRVDRRDAYPTLDAVYRGPRIGDRPLKSTTDISRFTNHRFGGLQDKLQTMWYKGFEILCI
jgi:hypothetical protein